jgi:hypothetical protein
MNIFNLQLKEIKRKDRDFTPCFSFPWLLLIPEVDGQCIRGRKQRNTDEQSNKTRRHRMIPNDELEHFSSI